VVFAGGIFGKRLKLNDQKGTIHIRFKIGEIIVRKALKGTLKIL
jgi:hypothetical protein